ncbi:Uncharacterised protein [Chryseobacterium taklimakanense]|uniref:Uncharacterized protein n=1 Tax=Chryseobacterium taklimakanense TaxID=536441 RepID=A0A239WKG2_9FLAO|nr:Uncharacterised protein [Chryseobacterium taklimakanense]
MEKNTIYFLGFGLYMIVLIISIIIFRKTKGNSFKFLLYSGLILLSVNLIYLLLVKIFNNSYSGVLLIYASIILNLLSIPTIVMLFILKLIKK